MDNGLWTMDCSLSTVDNGLSADCPNFASAILSYEKDAYYFVGFDSGGHCCAYQPDAKRRCRNAEQL